MKLNPQHFKKISFDVKSHLESPTIHGLYVRSLKTWVDGRGDLTEIWSEGWSDPNVLLPKHIYYNLTDVGVIKGWHWHEETYSQFVCLAGKMQIVTVDINSQSPTYGHVNQFIASSKSPLFIKIPPFVAKGWKALGEGATIINFLTSFGNRDNHKVPLDSFLPHVWQPLPE